VRVCDAGTEDKKDKPKAQGTTPTSPLKADKS